MIGGMDTTSAALLTGTWALLAGYGLRAFEYRRAEKKHADEQWSRQAQAARAALFDAVVRRSYERISRDRRDDATLNTASAFAAEVDRRAAEARAEARARRERTAAGVR